MTSPVTSTRVATNGAEALAGSKPTRRSTNGSMEPASEANNPTPPARARAGTDPPPARHDGQRGPPQGAEHHHPHEGGADRQRDQPPVRAVVVEAEQLPDGEPGEADDAEDRAHGP